MKVFGLREREKNRMREKKKNFEREKSVREIKKNGERN